MKCIVVFSFLAAACGLAAPVAAAGDRTPVDLPALLNELDRASPQLLASRSRAEAAISVAPQREALPDPKLSVSYTNDGLSSFTLGSSEFSNLTAGWEQEVPARSVRGSAAAVADAQAEALRASTGTLHAKLRARVITLYAELWRLDRTRTLLEETRALLATATDAARARYESGDGIQEGLIRAHTAVRRADLDLEELALERRQVEIALGSALGRGDDPAFGPALELPAVVAPIDGEALALAAAASSPEVLQTSAKERAAAAQLDDARVQTKPTYSWLAAYQFRGGLDPMVMGGFAVRLPVWKDRKQMHAVAAAANEHTATEHDREAAEVEARAGARELATDVASIDVRLRFYREAIIPQSAAAFDAAGAALSSGRAEMFLVLDDFGRWIDARREELALSARRVAIVASLEAMSGMVLFELPASGGVQ